MGNKLIQRTRCGAILGLCVMLGLSRSSAATPVTRALASGTRHTNEFEILRDAPVAYEVRRANSNGSFEHFMREKVESGNGRSKWVVHFASGTGDELSAWIVMAPGRVLVNGTANEVPFEFRAERGADGLFHDVRVFGDTRVETVFNLDDTADPRNRESAQALAAFTNTASSRSAWQAVTRFNALAPELLGRSAQASAPWPADGDVGSMVVAAVPESVASYVECLRTACGSDGGCWSGSGCHACAGDYFGVKLYSSLVYLIDLELCFAQHIVNPFR